MEVGPYSGNRDDIFHISNWETILRLGQQSITIMHNHAYSDIGSNSYSAPETDVPRRYNDMPTDRQE